MTIRIGFIGCGAIGCTHMELLSRNDDVQLAAFYDINKPLAENVARMYNGVPCESLEDMLDKLDIDAVWICIPPFAHAGQEIFVAEREIPFFVEKPVSLDLDLATRTKKAVDKAGILTCVGYHWRYKQSVCMAKIRFGHRTPFMLQGYWPCEAPDVEWWNDVNKSGGQIVEQITHIFDVARYMIGDIVEISGFATPAETDKGEIHKCAVVNMKFDNGAIGTIASSNCMNEEGTPWIKIHFEDEIMHIGSREVIFREKGANDEKYTGFDNGMDLEQRIFLDCITGKRESMEIRSTYLDAVKTLEVTLAANLAIKTGKPVKLS